MKRRSFFKTIGSIAPSALAVPLVHAASSKKHNSKDLIKQKEPRVAMFDDGRHAGGLYQMEPPLTPEDHAYNVSQLASSGVDTLVYFASVEGGSALYDSKAVQVWGDEVKKWTHYVWYRAGRILRQLIDDGHDPLKILCDRCHETDILMIASGWVSLHGGPREKVEGLGRSTAFTMDNPQFQVGDDPDPKAKGISTSRFSFLHEEVRQERLRLFEEMLAAYETDGIELNLTSAMPYCKFSEAERLAPIMTQWLRKLRAIADNAQEKQGRKKRIYARIPAHPDAWKLVGYEVPTWISENLVDGFFCESSYSEDEGMDQFPDLKTIIQLTRGTNSRVLYAFYNGLGRQLARYATPPMIWAAAANSYAQGADGFGVAGHHWTPNGWPWTAQEYDTLRLLGHSDLLATADKHYHVRSSNRQVESWSWLPGRYTPLPRTLTEGKSETILFKLADNLSHWENLGRVESVILRVRFTNFQPHYDKIKIKLNGQELPESILKKVDMTYRLLRMGPVNPYGYAFDYHLTPDYFPKQGLNQVTVVLLKRDPNVTFKMDLYDVDCSIKYRLHRHFEDKPIEY